MSNKIGNDSKRSCRGDVMGKGKECGRDSKSAQIWGQGEVDSCPLIRREQEGMAPLSQPTCRASTSHREKEKKNEAVTAQWGVCAKRRGGT